MSIWDIYTIKIVFSQINILFFVVILFMEELEESWRGRLVFRNADFPAYQENSVHNYWHLQQS